MPQYIWEGLFSVLNVLVPGIVLVLFAAYYQNRRKREIQIEGKLAMERVDGYEQLLFVFYEGQDNHEVTLEEEEKAAAILGYFDVPTFHFQCPNAFLDEAHFDAFYEKLEGLQKDYQIYLDEEASRQLDRSVAIYTHFKIMMDAFCDTEHTVDLQVEECVARKNIDWMYKLMGMMMFSHCTRAYAQLDQVVCKQMNRFYLTYRKRWVRRWIRSMEEMMLHRLERIAQRKGFVGIMSQSLLLLVLGKDERSFIHLMKTVIEVMRYVHFSDQFAPKEYFELKRVPTEKEVALYNRVFMAMVHRL